MPLDDEALKAMYGDMPERVLETIVEQALRINGWLFYHTHDSRRSESGFPDIVAARGERIIYRELKKEGAYLKPNQKIWRDRLIAAGEDWGLWRPTDWGRGTIMKEIE